MRTGGWLLTLAALALASGGCGSGGSAPTAPSPAPTAPSAVAGEPLPAAPTEAALLDAVFRIDVERVEVGFDVYPAERRVEARAEYLPDAAWPVTADRPLRPGAQSPAVSLRLDGRTWTPADARLLSFAGSGQISLELQRDLAGAGHRLEASTRCRDADGRFFTNVNDIQGVGNETLFPTLNTPHELARHRLVFRVHAAEPYVAVGSGLTSSTATGDVQQWTFDSERPVASYTMMFHLATARQHVLSERGCGCRRARARADRRRLAEEAFADLDPWLAELQGALGPFPMPRGLSVVLTQSGGGMEYYGATTTSLRALRHEVFHMYYACSTVARTYRDSWWDEAITCGTSSRPSPPGPDRGRPTAPTS